MKKRILALLLALCMLFSPAFIGTSYADQPEDTIITETNENDDLETTVETAELSEDQEEEEDPAKQEEGQIEDVETAEVVAADELEDTDEIDDEETWEKDTVADPEEIILVPEEKTTQVESKNSFVLETTSVEINVSEETTVYVTRSENESIDYLGDYDTNIVTAYINEDQDICIYGNDYGETSITVYGSNGTVRTIDVTVYAGDSWLDADGETDVSLTAGERFYIGYGDLSEYNVSYSSSNPKVASVEEGYDLEYYYDDVLYIQALTPGNAVITVSRQSEIVATYNVTVSSFLEKKSVSVKFGWEILLTLPEIYDEETGEYFGGYDYNVKTVDESVAYAYVGYDEYDESILGIQGLYPGKTTVIVYGRNGSSCNLSVTVTPPAFKLSASTLKVTSPKNTVVTSSGSCIKSVKSSDTSVLTVKKTAKNKLQITPVKAGKATVTVTNYYGTKKTITVTVDKTYFKALLTSKTTVNKLNYAVRNITGKSAPGATVSTVIGKHTYTAKVNAKGTYSLRIPIRKVGESIKLTFKLKGQSITKTVKVQRGNSKVWLPNWTYKNTTKVLVKATTVHKGDKIKLVVGKKTYYYNITKDASSLSVTMKINKPNTYGIKMRVYLMNKYNQSLAYEDDYVYHSRTVHLNDSKAKVKWIVDWNDPVEIDTYSSGEFWYYDWQGDDGIYDAYLYFNKSGKVRDWWIQN